MKRFIIFCLYIIYCLNATAQNTARTAGSFGAYFVQAKNYYLLTLLMQDKPANDLLKSDPVLTSLFQKKLAQLQTAVNECKTPGCFIEAEKLSADDIKQAGDRLNFLYKKSRPLQHLVKTKLIPSGTYSLYNALPANELLIKAWEQDATAVNYNIDVYGAGKKPNYPVIDSISYNVGAKGYVTLVYDHAVTLLGDLKNNKLFFGPALKAALLYLEINERDNAGDYEPMASTVNKSAFKYIKAIKWAKYPYTNILVPGAGPENLTTPLSGEGMLRCRLAAQQYRLGVAPLIMVSGGKAHPYKTKYCEAMEMKEYLINVLGIPAKAIIAEPHARHTTTNLRNCARLIYKYGISTNRPGVIVTDKSQTDFILGMDKRCLKELGCVPYKLAKRLSDTEVEYYPLPVSRQIDPDEPLDP